MRRREMRFEKRQATGAIEPDPAELFARGKFAQMRDAFGQRGTQQELHLFLNYLRALRDARSKMPQGHVSKRFLQAEPESAEYYKELFFILKEAGFTSADRPAIEEYFEAVRTENEQPIPGEERYSVRLDNLKRSLDTVTDSVSFAE